MTDPFSWERLFEAAARARANAHAPYSKFLVGAAVVGPDGEIVAGCNVENSSYGLTICAERNAIAHWVSLGHRELRAVAIIADTPLPCPPCGMCRQTLSEFAGRQLPVRSRNLQGAEQAWTVEELLPHAFSRSFL